MLSVASHFSSIGLQIIVQLHGVVVPDGGAGVMGAISDLNEWMTTTEYCQTVDLLYNCVTLRN